MGADDIDRPSRVPFFEGLADADDGGEPCRYRRLPLGLDRCAAFAVVGAPFRVPHDDVGAAQIDEHRGGNVSGMGTGRGGVAVLPAEFDP